MFAPIYLLLLIPLSLLFGSLVRLRRVLYRFGVFRVERLPVPVIVVGNLNVGGSGKTPLTLALVQWLRQAGFTPGIVSRGYGGSARAVMPVQADSDPALVGDEPVLMARRVACPIWIGRKRAEAGRELLAFHPEVDVLIADDGLQHIALTRDVELVVVDAARGFGNGRLLPAGPLREPLARLRQVDAVVVNGARMEAMPLPTGCPRFSMRIAGANFVNLAEPETSVDAAHFVGESVHAIAGIGHPERFFKQLAGLGIDAIPHAFADHHAFVESDLPVGTVLMTEKDAVKCARFSARLDRRDLWFLVVDAVVDAGLKDLIINLLCQRKRTQNGSKTA
ncbi:MAG: tetraacyldisaccharide 4'-kinase [Hydrogenophilales bacterium 28-61-23]|nr:MAG: tetraacyldisaccharide 4'-kinase [Hydrogenophilales bacterium 28-61-23]